MARMPSVMALWPSSVGGQSPHRREVPTQAQRWVLGDKLVLPLSLTHVVAVSVDGVAKLRIELASGLVLALHGMHNAAAAAARIRAYM